jgi:hypothetical protein
MAGRRKDIESGKMSTEVAKAAVGPQLAMAFHVVAMAFSCAILERTALCEMMNEACAFRMGLAVYAAILFFVVFVINGVAMWMLLTGVEYTKARVIVYYSVNFLPVLTIFVAGCMQASVNPVASVSIVISLVDIGLLGYRIWAAFVYDEHYNYVPPKKDEDKKRCCGVCCERVASSFKVAMMIHLMLLGLLVGAMNSVLLMAGVTSFALLGSAHTYWSVNIATVGGLKVMMGVFDHGMSVAGAIVIFDLASLIATLKWTPPKWTVVLFYITNLVPAGITTWLCFVAAKGHIKGMATQGVSGMQAKMVLAIIPVALVVLADVCVLAVRMRTALRTK